MSRVPRSIAKELSESAVAAEPPARPEARPTTATRPEGEVSVRQLFEEHADFLRTGLARLTGWVGDPDDLLQDVFVVALRRREALAKADSPRAWLYGVAVKLASERRRRQRWRSFLGLEAASELPHEGRNPAELAEQNDDWRRLFGLLEKLSERKRTVFILYELQELSGEEIALALGCPIKTVWSRLHHAREELLEHLARLDRREAPWLRAEGLP